jgi:sugar phosphate isomerase/epimerase
MTDAAAIAGAPALKLGSTLFSFTNAFLRLDYSFEQLLAKVAERDLGPGVEVIGFQSIRGFPTVTDGFAERFRELMAIHRLEPSCLAINGDVALRRGTRMTTEESVAYHEPQLRAAAKLGFPLVRYQFTASPEVIRQLVPLAERLGVKMGLEIHAPQGVHTPEVLAYREMYARVQSPCLGFIPDFGASARGVPPPYLDILRAQGMPPELIAAALEIWATDDRAPNKRQRLVEVAQGRLDPLKLSALAVIFNMFSPQPAAAWLEIMPQVIHIHGKFYGFDAAGSEYCIPYEDLLPVFVEAGFDGFMSSEWEGHMYSLDDGFDMVAQHHALCRRILANPFSTPEAPA